MTNRQDLAQQVTTTLGDHSADFDVDAIVESLIASYAEGPWQGTVDLTDIDAIDAKEYWTIVESHELIKEN